MAPWALREEQLRTPADIAGAVETAKAADTDSGMNESFLEKKNGKPWPYRGELQHFCRQYHHAS